jgi:hypothetical protein
MAATVLDKRTYCMYIQVLYVLYFTLRQRRSRPAGSGDETTEPRRTQEVWYFATSLQAHTQVQQRHDDRYM